MRKIKLLLIHIFLILPLFVDAQVQIKINDINKIHLIDAAGYVVGGFRNEYDLVKEGGQWKTYQTREQFDKLNLRAKTKQEAKRIISRDSAEHQFIVSVPEQVIQRLLKSIKSIKPKFNAADLKVSLPNITKQIDTGNLKYMNEQQLTLFNSFFNTSKKLNRLLDTLQHDGWTDDYPMAAIEIIKTGGDTIKVYSNRQIDYMLPWMVNNVPSFDLGINEFFIKATGLVNHRMSGKFLPYHLYSWVNYLYASDALERLRWKQIACENVTYIHKHFDIVKVAKGEYNSFYTFHPKTLNKHILIAGQLNIKDIHQLHSTASYSRDTLSRILKANQFMIDSCLRKDGCTVTFANSLGRSNHEYSNYNKKELVAYLKSYKQEELWPFTIKMGNRLENDWIALPDGKFILYSYIDDYVIGVSPNYIKKNVSGFGGSFFMVFSPDGELIHQDGHY